MADGKRMSDYTGIDEAPQLTPAEKAYYKQNALVTAVGKINDGASTPYSNYNIPLSEIAPSAPVSDVTVNGSSVVNDGVAAITVPTTSVPDPGTDMHRGHFLKVNNADDIVWSEVPVPELRGSDTVTYDASNSGALAVKYNTNTLDEDSTHGLTVKLPVPDTTGANEGDVLTVDSNGDIDWVAPSGGGGSDIVYLDLSVEYRNDAWHLTASSLTAQQIIAHIESGHTIIARIFKRDNNTVINAVQLPVGEYWNGTMYGPTNGYNIWFGPAGGSGAQWEGSFVRITTMRQDNKLKWISYLWDVSDLDEP